MKLSKRLILFCCLTFTTQLTFSQAVENIQTIDSDISNEEKSVMILHLGASFPSGNFADTENGGAAKNGFSIGVEFHYNITETFYVGAMYRNHSYKVDEPAMQRSLAAQMQPGIGVSGLSVGNWKLNNYLIGLGTISPLNNNEIEFYTKMMMGLCSGKSPSIQTTLSDGNSDLVINQTSGDANNFAALFGLGFRIHAGESVDIMIAGDYFTSTLEYEDILVTAQGQGTMTAPPAEQETDVMSLTFGLVFKL